MRLFVKTVAQRVEQIHFIARLGFQQLVRALALARNAQIQHIALHGINTDGAAQQMRAVARHRQVCKLPRLRLFRVLR